MAGKRTFEEMLEDFSVQDNKTVYLEIPMKQESDEEEDSDDRNAPDMELLPLSDLSDDDLVDMDSFNLWMPGDLPVVPVETFNEMNGFKKFKLEEDQEVTELEYFFKFFHDDLIESMVEYSELYRTLKELNNIQPITAVDIKKFLLIFIISGFKVVPSISMYWSQDEILGNRFIGKILSRRRFWEIKKCLRFNDYRNWNGDQLAKVRFLIDSVNESSQRHLPPDVKIFSIDESMVRYVGRRHTVKPMRLGYKVWSTCATNGYHVFSIPFTGAGPVNEQYRDFGVGGSVVLESCRVVKQLIDSDFHIFFGQNFTSVKLMLRLESMNIKAMGAMKRTRLGNCPLTQPADTKDWPVGKFESFIMQDRVILTQWKHKSNNICILNNFMGTKPTGKASRYNKKEKKKEIFNCPAFIPYYNKNIEGVNRMDANIHCHESFIGGKQWWWPFIRHYFEVCIQNAWLLFRTRREIDGLKFRMNLAKQLAQHLDIAEERPNNNLTESHFLAKASGQRRCCYCKHGKSSYECRKCDKGYHILCFPVGHNLK